MFNNTYLMNFVYFIVLKKNALIINSIIKQINNIVNNIWYLIKTLNKLK